MDDVTLVDSDSYSMGQPLPSSFQSTRWGIRSTHSSSSFSPSEGLLSRFALPVVGV